MQIQKYDVLEPGPMPSPGREELAELVRLRKRFPGHRIFYNVTDERGIRYLAYAAGIDVRPHTIITPDLPELRDALEL